MLSTSAGFASENKINTADIFKFAVLETSSPVYLDYYELLYSEVMRRLDKQAEFIYYPNRRASEVANTGIVDAEPARILGYEAKFTNLIRVDFPVIDVSFRAYSARSDIKNLNGWESLSDTPFRVTYRRGLRAPEKNLPKYVDDKLLKAINGPVNGFQMLVTDRADIYIDAERTAVPELSKMQDRGVRMVGLLEKTLGYMYVHKKHKQLVPEIEKVLRDLASEGKLAEFQKVLTPKF